MADVRKFMKRTTIMQVVTVDKHGNQMGEPETVYPPEPDHIAEGGADHISDYMDRLIRSDARFASLSIFSPTDKGIGLFKRESELEVFLTANCSDPTLEQGIRSFFQSRSIAPSLDYLANHGDTRVLQFPLKLDRDYASELCRDILSDIFNLAPKSALNFTFQEQK